jgi:hypothetical protein
VDGFRVTQEASACTASCAEKLLGHSAFRQWPVFRRCTLTRQLPCNHELGDAPLIPDPLGSVRRVWCVRNDGRVLNAQTHYAPLAYRSICSEAIARNLARGLVDSYQVP